VIHNNEPQTLDQTKLFPRSRRPGAWRLRAGERIWLLLTGDTLAAVLAMVAALYVWAQEDWLDFSFEFIKVRPQTWFYLLPIVWLVLLVELYDIHRAHRRSEIVKGVAIAVLVSLGLYMLIYFTNPDPNSLPRRGVAVFIAGAGVLTLGWRMIYIAVFTAPQFMRRVLIIGAGKSGTTLAQVIKGTWPPPFYLVGLIDDDPQKQGKEVFGYPVLGGVECMLEVIQKENVSDLIFAISGEMRGETFQAVLDAREQGIDVTTMPVIYEELLNRVPIFLLQSDWILRSFIDQARTNGFYEIAKRIMDIAIGCAGMLVMVLVAPFVCLAIALDSGFPIFFRQYRLGRRGQLYRIIKFRTMVQNSESDGYVRTTQENDDRITRIGKFLRKSHLDELPQLINVLVGDMSLVGPRAERAELVDHLQSRIPFYRARLLVKPGITGWAQVNFGYAASVEDSAIKLEYDLYYIKHRNLLLDLVILAKTFRPVIGMRGQ